VIRRKWRWLAISLQLLALVAFIYHSVQADSVATSVTVGNSAPSFTVDPAESPASSSTSPTDVGSSITFTATASDPNNESYYLIICKTNSVSPTNGGAPTCPGGSWCVSAATTSGSQASCSYTTQQSDSESNDWYAFVCDGNSSAASCSTASQGTGDSGSPFKVNHPPSFTAISNDGPADPGATVTWTATASDGDLDGTADTVKLVVCKTAGISAGDCDGGASDRWCASALTSSNPSCSYSVPVPTADQAYNAYAYVVDNHNLGSSDTTQGSNSSYTVNNVAPVVSAVTINSGTDITLTEGTTTSVVLGATITDNNGCGDVSTATASAYRSGIGYAACDTSAEANDNNCYPVINCSVVASGNTCDGASDASADYECTVSMQYHADPTDLNTQYPTENWLDSVIATDDNGASHRAEVSTGVEVNSLVALDVTGSISYGNLTVGQKNDPLDKTTTVTGTGNVGLDVELSGTDMSSGSDTIAVTQQKYALAASTAYASGASLTTTATEVELNVAKTTDNASPATKTIWWGIEIPSNTPPGTYSGTNTVGAVKGETVDW